MPTLREIADIAGCSVATVSRVLNGGHGVRPETRSRVQRAEFQLRQAESGGPQGMIAVIVPDLLNPYFSQIAHGIEEEAYQRGYGLLLGNLSRTAGKATRFAQFLQDRQVDRVILAGGGVINPEFQQIWAELARYANLVCIGRHSLDCATISIDDVAGGMQAVEHLIQLGHREIAMVCGPSNSVPALDRLEGYMTVLFNHGITYCSDRILEGDYSAQSGYQAGLRLLDKPNLPTAVFCSNDLMAVGLLRAFRERAIAVPRDISVVGYDHLNALEFSWPRLTSVAVPMEEMGRTAVRRLLDGNDRSTALLPTSLVIGETTAVPWVAQ